MRLLLDTCTFLWLASDDPRLSPAARQLFQDPANEVFLSAVSVWEIAIKHALGKLPLSAPPQDLIPQWRDTARIQTLPVTEEAALRIADLPDIHHDPFDRMLISQAITDGLVLLTPDPQIRKYAVEFAW